MILPLPYIFVRTGERRPPRNIFLGTFVQWSRSPRRYLQSKPCASCHDIKWRRIFHDFWKSLDAMTFRLFQHIHLQKKPLKDNWNLNVQLLFRKHYILISVIVHRFVQISRGYPESTPGMAVGVLSSRHEGGMYLTFCDTIESLSRYRWSLRTQEPPATRYRLTRVIECLLLFHDFKVSLKRLWWLN